MPFVPPKGSFAMSNNVSSKGITHPPESPAKQRNSSTPLISTPGKGRNSVSRLTGDTISSSLKKRLNGGDSVAATIPKTVGFKGVSDSF